jgi:hypothetical protein
MSSLSRFFLYDADIDNYQCHHSVKKSLNCLIMTLIIPLQFEKHKNKTNIHHLNINFHIHFQISNSSNNYIISIAHCIKSVAIPTERKI